MNEKQKNMSHPDDESTARKLNKVAEQTQASSQFAAELEEKLRSAHRPKSGWFTKLSPALGWMAVMVVLALVLSWSIKSLVPVPQPSGNGTPNGFICPVTQPNGSLPPGTQASETTSDTNLYGNGELWTVLKPDGKVYLFPENRRSDGLFEMVWPWYLGAEGQLTIEGKRLDGQTEPLQFVLAEPFKNFQGSTLIFSTPGCWEITGHLGQATLSFVTEILLDSGIPTPTAITTPNIVSNGTPTAIVEGGYDWRQTKLYLAVPLPASPAEVNVAVLKDEQPATMDTALALASQFGIQGDIFQIPGNSADSIAYLVSDGRQRLYVETSLKYDYYTDYGAFTYMNGDKNITEDKAAPIIDEFLKSHGLNFEYKLDNPHMSPGMMYVLPVSPEGLPVYRDYNIPARLEFIIDANGQVIRVTSYQVDYESVGSYGIRTAEEAFQQILDNSEVIHNGILEISRSSGISEAGFWSRSYPDNQTITIYGLPSSYPAAEPGRPPFVSIDRFTATGNTAGIENADPSAYIEATGQFIIENGIRKFHVDFWQVSALAESYISGTLRREGDRVILTADDNSAEYVIVDAPPDVPLNTKIPPDDHLAVGGVIVGDRFEWNSIQHYPAGSGGGGGGGSGTGFYKLNLSGTPVPFPSPTAQAGAGTGPTEYIVKEGDTCDSIATSFGVSIRNIISENNLAENCLIKIGDVLKIPGNSSSPSNAEQQIEGVRGILMVTIYKQADGSQRVEYGLYPKPNESPFFFASLQGSNIQELDAYHNRPIDIWGTVTGVDQNGMPQIQVERYEIPYPDLQFQILSGKQKLAELEGERGTLFTTSDGTTYAQLTSNGFPDSTILGEEGNDVILQTLAIPGDSFGGYPALRVFEGALVVNPNDSQPTELTGSAGKPNIVDETISAGMENYVPPTLTIEKVELVYYVPDPSYGSRNPNPGPYYLQPAWHFYGHYSDGSEASFLVQALKQEFLLPELEPYSGPG